MKRKFTPPEKKELAYDRAHRTHTGESDRAMSRVWAKRKARLNRKYRRLTDQLLREAIRPDVVDTVLAEEDGTTRELIRKGQTRETNSKKRGVGTLRDSVEAKLKSRSRPRETNRERRERLSRTYIGLILSLERDPNGTEAARLKKILGLEEENFGYFLETTQNGKRDCSKSSRSYKKRNNGILRKRD
jgi:hypothetical protein